MQNNNKKLIIITGATSYLGRNLSKFLIGKGYEVFGFVREDSSNIKYLKNINNLNIINYDMNTKIDNDNIPDSLSEFINICKNRDIYIYHLAWDSGSKEGRYEEDRQKNNFENSKNIINLAKIINAKRLIFTSSQAEDNNTAYGIYKKKFALYGKENFDHFVHTRIFSIYGGDDEKKTLINYLIECRDNNIEAKVGPCEHLWNFLHIDDFSYIFSHFLNDDIDENLIYDIAGPVTKPLKDFLNGIPNIKINYGAVTSPTEPFAIPNINNMLNLIGKNYKFKDFNI